MRQLSSRRKRQLLALLFLMTTSAFAEVISLGAVLPFIGALTAPHRLLANPAIARIADTFGIADPNRFILATTVLFGLTALISGGIRIFQTRVSTHLAYAIGADLGIEIYKRTLHQPYEVHKSRNSSEVISGVTRKVDGVVAGVIMPLLTLISSAILFISILTVLLVIDATVALAAAALFGSIYSAITILTRRRLRTNGQQIAKEQTKVFRALTEGLIGIREVLLTHSQDYYARIYRRSDTQLRRAQGNNMFLALAPRHGIEALSLALISLFAYSLVTGSNSDSALPILAALAVGGQRLLPTLQQGYAGLSTIIGYRSVLADAIELLEQPLPRNINSPIERLAFQEDIRFNSVCFTYSHSTLAVLADVNIVIEKGARVGLVGSTGSGKSTIADLLMGLLQPTSGQILVDGQTLNEDNIRAWQANIAHVPQTIYLSDGSFAQNIAFGEEDNEIDLDRVREAATQAQIAEFIQSCDDGYMAKVGENGGRLSGGQRQRIGIARALYRRASVIVFDEATSALDTATEEAVMDSVCRLDPNITVILIAHRISTLRTCTLVLELDGGAVRRKGTAEMILGSDRNTSSVADA